MSAIIAGVPDNSKKNADKKLVSVFGGDEGNRTLMISRSADFESAASASSATSPLVMCYPGQS